MAIPCLNCQQPVTGEAKFFHDALVCDTCHTMATHLYNRARSELTDLLVMLQDSIRIAICDRRFQFPELANGGELSKKEVLEAIVRLQEMKDARTLATPSSTPPSSES